MIRIPREMALRAKAACDKAEAALAKEEKDFAETPSFDELREQAHSAAEIASFAIAQLEAMEDGVPVERRLVALVRKARALEAASWPADIGDEEPPAGQLRRHAEKNLAAAVFEHLDAHPRAPASPAAPRRALVGVDLELIERLRDAEAGDWDDATDIRRYICDDIVQQFKE